MGGKPEVIPIYEQRGNHGDGYTYEQFVRRFDEICQEHLKTHRAKAFAFLFYDFRSPFKDALKDQHVFKRLNNLAGRDLSVFYLHAPRGAAVARRFTKEFTKALQLDAEPTLPCVIFFKLAGDKATHIVVKDLPDHEALGFHDLYTFIQAYIAGNDGKVAHLIKAAVRFVALEGIKAAIEHFVGAALP